MTLTVTIRKIRLKKEESYFISFSVSIYLVLGHLFLMIVLKTTAKDVVDERMQEDGDNDDGEVKLD